MNTIEIKNLHFSYNAGEEILKGLNLTIDERSTAIIGQNGAGKTTFVKLLDLFSRIRMTRFSKIQFWMK